MSLSMSQLSDVNSQAAVLPPNECSYTNISSNRRLLNTNEQSKLRIYRTKSHQFLYYVGPFTVLLAFPYSNSFGNASATNESSKIGCHGNIPRVITKSMQDLLSASISLPTPKIW